MKALYKIIFPVLALLLMSASLKAQYVTNHAAKFNGTNSHISFASSMENDLRNGYTIEAWVYYSHIQGPTKIIFMDTAGISLAISGSGSVSFSYSKNSTALLDPFPVEKWTHLAATYDGATLKVYYNGELQNSVTTSGVIPPPSPMGYVGGIWHQGNVHGSFSGMLDDFRIWRKAKTPYEITRDMNLSLSVMRTTGVYKDLAVSYRFDVTSGNVAYDEAGTHPAYGNTSNVTFEDYTNDPAEYSTFNSTLILDGTTAYCVAPPYETFNVSSALTLEAWAKLDMQAPRNSVQEIVGKANTNSYSYRLFIKDDTTAVFMVNAGTGYSIESTISNPFVWNHISGTYDGQTGEMKIYINGELAKTEFKIPAPIQDTQTDSVYVGKSGMTSTGSTLFKGQLDEVRIWAEKKRTATEIKSHLNVGISYRNDPWVDDACVWGFDGRTDNATRSVNGQPFTALAFYGSAYMRSGRLNAPIYSVSPLVWQAPGNFIDATWNLSQKSVTLPPSGVISDSIYYATDGLVQNAKVMVLLNTANIHNTKVKLIAPDGTTIQLTPDHSSAYVKSDLMTIFSDNASQTISYQGNSMAPFSPSFKPYEQLSSLNGKNRKGWWKLKMEINGVGSEGQLVKWGIQNSILTSQTGSGEIVLNSYKLDQNYPNPFNPATKIKFELPADVTGLVKLSVFDITGREVAVLANGALKPGAYEYTWNAEGFSSGIYFYTLKTKGGVITKKMLLVK